MRSCAKRYQSGGLLRLLALISVEIGALPVLQRLGSLTFLRTPGTDPPAWQRWLASTPPQDALASVLRLVAMACAWWLVAGTGLYLAARLVRVPGLVHAVEWTTPAAVRRVIDRALALSMLATLAGGTAALAATPQPVPVPIPVVQSAPAPAIRATPAVAAPVDRRTVRPGDNLWSIAAGSIAAGGATPSSARIAPYWRVVVDRNRASLRSGNPNLIFPGETISLPPTT
jgi:hypothetical protein